MKQHLMDGLPLLGLELNETTCDTLVAFGRAMVKQNEVMNLTGITDDKGVAMAHLLDSLTVMCAASLFLPSIARWWRILPWRKSKRTEIC